jgi:hypothetical protein
VCACEQMAERNARDLWIALTIRHRHDPALRVSADTRTAVITKEGRLFADSQARAPENNLQDPPSR